MSFFSTAQICAGNVVCFRHSVVAGVKFFSVHLSRLKIITTFAN